jgi:hypothetical protein
MQKAKLSRWLVSGVARRVCSALALAALGLHTLSGAATAQEGSQTVDFLFSNPGARSMGFGGAFVALADDATAAFANPAGLVQLLRPEVSGEARFALESGSADDDDLGVTGLGFVSVVYPGRGWSVAGYGHRVASFTVFDAGTDDATSDRNLVVASYGFSGSYRLSEQLSLGLGIAYFDGSRESTELFDSTGSDSPKRGGNDWSATGGLLWSPGGGWKLGAALREGARLEFESSSGSDEQPLPLVFPGVLAVGGSWLSEDGRLTLSWEWDRVRYSSLTSALPDGGLSTGGGPIRDGDQLHAGAEYVFLEWSPITAFRAGVWTDKDRPALEPSPEDDDELHVSGGIGLAWQRFQLDLGVDISRRRSTVSLSGIISF